MVGHCLARYSLNRKEISVWTLSSHWVVSLRKTLSSHVAPVHPEVQKGAGELSEKSNKTRKEGEGEGVHFSMSKTTAGQRKFNSNITRKEWGVMAKIIMRDRFFLLLKGRKKKSRSENLKFLRLGFIVMLNFKLTF